MKIYFGADHAGFELKQELVSFVEQGLGYEVEDCGAFKYDPDDDYPDFVAPVAEAVSAQPNDVRGVILGGSGQGEAILANRFAGVRAVVFNGQYDSGDGRDIPPEIILSRQHNDSNILSLGARFLNLIEARSALEQWLQTPFSSEVRHIRRLQKIESITLKLRGQ